MSLYYSPGHLALIVSGRFTEVFWRGATSTGSIHVFAESGVDEVRNAFLGVSVGNVARVGIEPFSILGRAEVVVLSAIYLAKGCHQDEALKGDGDE